MRAVLAAWLPWRSGAKFWFLFGIMVVAMGVYTLIAVHPDPNAVPTCNGQVMNQFETCNEVIDGKVGPGVSYDDLKSQAATKGNPIVSGVIVAGGAVIVAVAYRKRHRPSDE